VGGTTEANKWEGITYDKDNGFIYTAISTVERGMEDNLRQGKPNNSSFDIGACCCQGPSPSLPLSNGLHLLGLWRRWCGASAAAATAEVQQAALALANICSSPDSADIRQRATFPSLSPHTPLTCLHEPLNLHDLQAHCLACRWPQRHQGQVEPVRLHLQDGR
jgi:hypothetical protein